MSKYIVDIDDFEPHFKVDSIGVFGIGKSLSYSEEDHSWSRIKSIEEFEELNSDYINEHFGELQDEAYKQGYEDGKNIIDNGCEGCKYTVRFADDEPCKSCSNCYKNKYEPMPQEDDRIEVGDEVQAPCGIATVTSVKDDFVHYLYSDGDVGCIGPHSLKKTGKHYDIQSILEAMRNE